MRTDQSLKKNTVLGITAGTSRKEKPDARRTEHSSRDHFIITLIISDVTDVTLGASGHWLETRTRAGDTATLA